MWGLGFRVGTGVGEAFQSDSANVLRALDEAAMQKNESYPKQN